MAGRRDVREAVQGGATFGLIFGVGAFLVLLTFMGLDYRSTRNAPTEQATVVSSERTDSKAACGPRSLFPDTPGVRTGFHSESPPPALPADFSVVQCPDLANAVGDVVAVRRTGTAADEIALDPFESASDWIFTAVVGGVACTVIGVAVAVVRELWSVRRSRRRRARSRARRLEESDRALTNPSADRPDSEEDPWPPQHPH